MYNLTKRDQPDRSKINMSEDFEVKYWLKALGVSKDELKRAVEKVGNSAAAVRKELGVRRAKPYGGREPRSDFRSAEQALAPGTGWMSARADALMSHQSSRQNCR